MRLQKLREAMQRHGVDAALITTAENVKYYSRFTGTSSQVLITQHGEIFFTDFRYTEQAEDETDFNIVETKDTARIQTIFEYVKKENVKRLGIDLAGVSYMAYKAYSEHIDESHIIDISSEISLQRSVKEEDELAAIAKGAEHNDKLFAHICQLIRPGVSENDIKAEIIYYMNTHGADSAFAPIVASGPHSSLPHATPTDRKLSHGDFVTLDYGCKFDGYCSDFTRTIAISHMDKAGQTVYDIVKRAGDKSLLLLTSGIEARRVDAVARNYITEMGYGNAFGHGLGHGVGLFIHEAPSMNHTSEAVLTSGMVITVEPGIYIKGEYGVRIEDLCVIKDGGYINLTTAPRDIIIL
ncbi:MAG: M24 family metallopeptidase [Christensenellales bacterium]|jgi:Xaa-Pro aminopeptidase